ncbi:Choline transporter-like protein 5 [Tupaia chinensis]|uniref:Choline transporter-like protein n=1 Tax=Tupaia chinensis TaxID=246437 RepID=L9KZC2_TUPCH|nr:Choline transporter-like protein 5 [Tupaia chinensis]
MEKLIQAMMQLWQWQKAERWSTYKKHSFLATSGIPIYKIVAPEGNCIHENKTCNPETFNTTEIAKACPGALCNFASYGGKSLYHQYISTFQIYNLFVFLWLINFVIALGQCALAGAFATYYWAKKKPDDIPPYPLFTAFGRAIRYHTGSLAFGSLILALVQMFKVILEYLDRRLRREDLERNDGSTEKPYFITPNLHGILVKKQLAP